jgi:hypothetical protein
MKVLTTTNPIQNISMGMSRLFVENGEAVAAIG